MPYLILRPCIFDSTMFFGGGVTSSRVIMGRELYEYTAALFCVGAASERDPPEVLMMFLFWGICARVRVCAGVRHDGRSFEAPVRGGHQCQGGRQYQRGHRRQAQRRKVGSHSQRNVFVYAYNVHIHCFVLFCFV